MEQNTGVRRLSVFGAAGSENLTFSEATERVQKHISERMGSLVERNDEEAKAQMKAYISKYLEDHTISVEGLVGGELVDRLYQELSEYSFLTRYLAMKEVEEININSWDDVQIIYADGSVNAATERFSSSEAALDITKRMLRDSGMILDYANPIVRGHLGTNIRVTAACEPLIDKGKGVVVSIRIINPKKLSREDFIEFGTGTAEMLDTLTLLFNYGISMCITGSTGSGKTTLMSYVLSTVPNSKRIVTIENNVREFDLVKRDAVGNVVNNVVNLVTKESEQAGQSIDQEKLLE
jgi:pilus assembly protein CpaF